MTKILFFKCYISVDELSTKKTSNRHNNVFVDFEIYLKNK